MVGFVVLVVFVYLFCFCIKLFYIKPLHWPASLEKLMEKSLETCLFGKHAGRMCDWESTES